jgi:hypothetical protein
LILAIKHGTIVNKREDLVMAKTNYCRGVNWRVQTHTYGSTREKEFHANVSGHRLTVQEHPQGTFGWFADKKKKGKFVQSGDLAETMRQAKQNACRMAKRGEFTSYWGEVFKKKCRI